MTRSTCRAIVEPNVHAKPFGDGIVLLDFARGDYFSLDTVGAFVWSNLVTGSTFHSVAELVATEFDVAFEIALADILSLVDRLANAGLVRIVD